MTIRFVPLFLFLFSEATLFAQQRITGVVTGVNELPLSGATVAIKGSKTAAETNADGVFIIDSKPQDVLIVSYVGYSPRQVTVGNEVHLKISLNILVNDLDEVIVTGYTSQRIKEITGSVAVVRPKDLVAVPAGQVEQMLQGRVAGLNVVTSGMPGSTSNVRLHGIGNFGDVTPLYVIDGVQGNINNLNPDDIETIQVLKDAGAYSIYGVRGANGVVVITTRSGKPGKTKISYDFYLGVAVPSNHGLDLLNPQEQADLTWMAYKNAGQVDANGNPTHPWYGNGPKPILPDYLFAGSNTDALFEGDPRADPSLYNIDFSAGPIYQIVPANKKGTDWFNEAFSPAISQNHSLTFSGGNDKNKYLFSLGYLDQQGALLNTYLKRFTARINTSFSLNNNIRVGENLQWSYRNNPRIDGAGPNGNEVINLKTALPVVPVHDIKGAWSSYYSSGRPDENVIARRSIAKDDKTNDWETFGNVFGEIDFLKNFTLRTSFGGTIGNYYRYKFNYNGFNARPDGLPDNSFTEASGYRTSWTWTNTINFSKTISDKHTVKILMGTEAIDNYNREVGGSRSGLFTGDPNYRFLSNGVPASQSNYSLASTSSLYSFFSQGDYSFSDKYFFRATVRRDGSSVFSVQNRYGWFPSFSAAWRITEEKFATNLNWLTDLKLRASWGQSGFYGNTDPFNQYTLYGGTVGDAYYDIYGTNNSAALGFRTTRIGDPKTGWQKDVVLNAGFESILWKGKLSITADLYRKKASGLLFPISLPDVVAGNATPPNINIGTIQNSGVDVLLGSKGHFTGNWSWDFALTFTTYHNRVIKLNDIPFFDPPFSESGPFVRNAVGQPMSSFYGYKIIGFFQDDGDVAKSPKQEAAKPGRFKYLDANGDGEISDDDRIYFGNANPDFTAGINIGFTYKAFDFSSFLYGSFGNEVMNVARLITDIFPGLPGQGSGVDLAKSKTALYDSWTPEHKNATAPIVENDFNFSNLGAISSYPMENGSYFRCKSIMLGYSFAKNKIQKLKIENLRVYVQAVNLFTITNYSGLDPEVSGFSDAWGVDFGNYPTQRQFLFGLNVNF